MKDWLRKHPQVRTIRVAAADLNGQPRGKRIPARFAEKLATEGTRFPFSVLNLDIWGEDIEDSPLVFEQGDADGVLKPTERGFMPMPWLEALEVHLRYRHRDNDSSRSDRSYKVNEGSLKLSYDF